MAWIQFFILIQFKKKKKSSHTLSEYRLRYWLTQSCAKFRSYLKSLCCWYLSSDTSLLNLIYLLQNRGMWRTLFEKKKTLHKMMVTQSEVKCPIQSDFISLTLIVKNPEGDALSNSLTDKVNKINKHHIIHSMNKEYMYTIQQIMFKYVQRNHWEKNVFKNLD